MVNAYSQTENKSITVTGKGTIEINPDIAKISVGITTEDKNAKTAQELNAKKMNDLITNIKKLGISEEDIQTVNYSIYPKYSYLNNENKQIGYTVTNMVNVVVRDISKVSEILDTSVASGGNTGGGIIFSSSKSDEYYAKAVDAAIKNASSKANAIASAINVKLGLPQYITDISDGQSPVRYAEKQMQDIAYNTVNTPIQPGKIEITAVLSVVYEY